jgi:PhzF family phenazine biosynthesis protein
MYKRIISKNIKYSLIHFIIIFLLIIIAGSYAFTPLEQEDKTMEIPVYIVNAFTEKRFGGNPAAVCPLQEWLDDDLLQSIASEHNLSETAFFVRKGNIYELRWFTPEVEVDLCGHATLATAHVLFEHLDCKDSQITFETKSGRLIVKRNKELYLMDFPVIRTTPQKIPKALEQCLGSRPTEILMGSWLYLAVFENDEKIKSLNPDFDLMKKLEKDVIVTAKGRDTIDFVSRYFAPCVGIPEDPVTGSAHCALVPFWSGKLNKTTFYARQLSKRGGELYCEYLGDRVIIGGKAITFSIGRIILENNRDH